MTTPWDGEEYAARFAALAAAGKDLHGEARFVAALVDPGARILDAGCGTGRVAVRLAELGYDVAGADVDASMMAVARRSPEVRWYLADLSDLDLDEPPFDLVVAAGNVVPFLAAGTGPRVLARLAAHLASGGLLVAGFGLDRAHLPPPAAIVDIADYDSWCAAAGLVAVSRHATWDGDGWSDSAGYAVSVHRRP